MYLLAAPAALIDRVLVLTHRKRQADAVAVLHVALAVGDAVEHIAARRGAERVSLILADLELRAGHHVEELIGASFGKLTDLVRDQLLKA